MKSINWGVIGPGSIADKFAKAMQSSVKGKITAVASRSSERAKAFADKYAIENIYTAYTDLVNDPAIDIIYIATPHSFHYEQAKLCLEAGKHVLVEKPCSVNAVQMQHLVDLAKAKNVLLQEGLWSRFMPCISKIKSLIEQGSIGDIQYIQSNIGFDFQNRGKPKERLLKAELAGGALLDLGIYSITLSQFFLQEHPASIHTIGKLSAEGVDEHAAVTMSYASGRYAQFSSSITAHASNAMHIVGSEGYVILPYCFWDADLAYVYQHGNLIQTLDMPHVVNGFEYEIEEVMSCIQSNKHCSDLMSHQDSLGVLKVMDEIRRQLGVVYPDVIERA